MGEQGPEREIGGYMEMLSRRNEVQRVRAIREEHAGRGCQERRS